MTTCPNCWLTPALDGSCGCDTPAPNPQPDAPTRRALIPLDTNETHTCTIHRKHIPAREQLEQQLADIPDLATHLWHRIGTSTPGDTAARRGPRIPSATPPVNLTLLHALDQRPRYGGDDIATAQADERYWAQHHADASDPDGRQGLHADITTWAAMIHADLDGYEPTPAPLPDNPSLTTACGWLIDHATVWASIHPDEAPELERCINHWHRFLRRELGETDPIQLRHRDPGDRHACGNLIEQATDGTFECLGCHQQWTLGEMMRRARLLSDVTAAEAADQLGISLNTVRQWHKRGRLIPVNDKHPRLFRLGDVRALAIAANLIA